MKGVTVNQLRIFATAVLDRVSILLATEPARLIGYGAAVVVFVVAQVLEQFRPGLLPKLTFESAIAITASAIVFLAIVVENIRRFVYSPMTYIEDLSDESQLSHDAAHMEEDLRRMAEEAVARREAELSAAQPVKRTVTVGSTKASGSGSKPD